MSQVNLLQVAGAQSTPIAEIVFVHGLGGHPKLTWMAQNGNDELFWPNWIASDIPSVNVWSLGYPAGFTDWTNDGGMALPSRAYGVLDYLQSQNIGTAPLIFIAHSLGGLMVKQLLRTAHDITQWRAFIENTVGCVFIATPHQGSSLANIAKAVPGVAASEATRGLTRDNPLLADLNLWYRSNALRLGIRTHAIAESKPMKISFFHVGLVVQPSSADPGVDLCVPISADGNHVEVCKPTSRKHPTYTSVLGFLKDRLQIVHSHTGLERPLLRAVLGRVAVEDQRCSIVLSSFNRAATTYTASAESTMNLVFHGETVSLEDSHAMMLVSSLLAKARGLRTIDVCTSTSGADRLDQNLVLIGSPLTNSQTGWALLDDEIAAPYAFDLSPFRITCRNRGCGMDTRLWYPNDECDNRRPGEHYRVDYAILARLSHPSLSTDILILAGLGPTGTLGAAYYLSVHWRLLQRTYGDKPFSLILRFGSKTGDLPSFRLSRIVHRTDPIHPFRCLVEGLSAPQVLSAAV